MVLDYLWAGYSSCLSMGWIIFFGSGIRWKYSELCIRPVETTRGQSKLSRLVVDSCVASIHSNGQNLYPS